MQRKIAWIRLEQLVSVNELHNYENVVGGFVEIYGVP